MDGSCCQAGEQTKVTFLTGFTSSLLRAVIKRRGLGISPGYYERGPWLLSKENRRKMEPKEIPSCLIPRLLVVFTWQLKILVTTLPASSPIWASETRPSLTRSRESHFPCPNRRACSQATSLLGNKWTTKVDRSLAKGS